MRFRTQRNEPVAKRCPTANAGPGPAHKPNGVRDCRARPGRRRLIQNPGRKGAVRGERLTKQAEGPGPQGDVAPAVPLGGV